MPKNPKSTQRKGCFCFNVLPLGAFHRRAFHRRRPIAVRISAPSHRRVEPPCLPSDRRGGLFLGWGGFGALGGRAFLSLRRPSPLRPPQSGRACAFCGVCVGAASLSVSVLSSGAPYRSLFVP